MAVRRRALESGARPTTGALEPLPDALLQRPLDYLSAAHLRHRCMHAEMRTIAESGRCSREAAERLIAFLTREVPLHHRDEDDDIFPSVLRRSVPEDGLEPVLRLLSGEHHLSERQATRIVEALGGDGDRDPIEIAPRVAELLTTFARREHRHLAIENGIVLVIARKRLKRADLEAITHSMRMRRGVNA